METAQRSAEEGVADTKHKYSVQLEQVNEELEGVKKVSFEPVIKPFHYPFQNSFYGEKGFY